ncbi:tape measure domain-containing protein [Rhodoligotrophos appendicifer]|uniref:tape measure protein n=1 Tax=Rhodoligotrophos appendicifer TaxID=987056 RepID=UPI001185AF16
MATDIERLVIQMSADINRLEKGYAQARAKTNQTAASIEQRFKRMNRNVQSSLTGFGKGLLAGAAGAISGRELLSLADGYTRVQNALKGTGLQGQELTKVYDQLFASAQRNAAPIEALVTLYAKLSLVQSQLGISQDELLGFTDRISLALRAGGTSAEQASGALLQLSQALGAGIVRAEEFSSIIDGTPTIALAMARGLEEAGGSVAKLRQLVTAGLVPSKALFDAFIFGSQDLSKQVASAETTFANSMTRIQNALKDTVGKLSGATGISDSLALALANVAEQIAFVGRNAQAIGGYLKGMDDWFKRVENSIGAAGRALGEYLGIRDNTLAGQLASGRPRDYGLQSSSAPAGPMPSLADPKYSTQGTNAPAKQKAEVDALSTSYKGLAADIKTSADAQKELEESWASSKELSQDFALSFAQGIRSGESAVDSLKNAVDRLVDSLIEMAIRMAATGIFKGIAGATASGPTNIIPGGYTTNAHGNVYGRGGLTPFARGGVVNRPTLFPFAQGTGLMGEAGPEAILPLKRGANGDLGVTMPSARRGGGPSVHMPITIVNNSDANVRTEKKDNGLGQQELLVMIDQAVSKKLGDPYSKSGKTMRAAYGAQMVPRRV